MSQRKERLLIEEVIKNTSFELEIDETGKGICPFCKATHEESFSVTRISEGLIYNCFRATCPAHGFISSLAGNINPRRRKEKEFKQKIFIKDLEPLPKFVVKLLNDKYELTREELDEQGIKFCRPEYRLFMPVFDFRNNSYGGISKTLHPNLRRFKTINYFTRPSTRLHYPQGVVGTGGAIAVTEDILSAIKVGRHIKAVAALGHSLSVPQIQELRQQTDTLILMLDGDVFQKALEHRTQYGLYFNNISVVLMGKDPKDEDDSILKQIIEDALDGSGNR